MMYLLIPTLTEAMDRSKDGWLSVLERPKNEPQDTTYLWDWVKCAYDDRTLLVIVPGTEEHLGQSEINVLKSRNDPVIVEIFNSLATPIGQEPT